MPDFVVWTGDNKDHGIYLDPHITAAATVKISKFFKYHCPNTVMFPIQGNHEYAPMNTQDFYREHSPVAEIIGEEWKEWLTDSVKAEYDAKTYFSYNATTHPLANPDFNRKMAKTRVIAMNTQNCYFFNFYLIGQFNDPGQEFEWLEKLLRQMEKDGEVGIVIGHIPPGDADCLHPVSERLRILYDRFQHIIRLSLFGHTHYEEIQLVRAMKDNKPINVNHVSPSFTPHLNQNPSIRAITLDVQTKLPIKIDTYTLDLEKANKDDKYAEFVFHHSLDEEYGASDLSPDAMLDIATRLKTDEELAKKYKINKIAHGRGSEEIRKNGCDESCRRMVSCDASFNSFRQTRQCYRYTDMDLFTFLSYFFDFVYGVWVEIL